MTPNVARRLALDLSMGLLLLGYFTTLMFLKDLTEPVVKALAWLQYPVMGGLAWLIARTAADDAVLRIMRNRLLAGLFLTAFALSLMIHLNDGYYWDATNSHARARMILESGGLVAHNQRVSLFYYMLAGAQALLGDTPPVSKGLTALFSLLFMFGVYRLVRFHYSENTALKCLALAATVPIFTLLAHWIYLDMTMMAMCVWTLVFFELFQQKKRIKYALLTGLFFLISLFFKEYALLTVCYMIAALISRKTSEKKPDSNAAKGLRPKHLAGAAGVLAFLALQFWLGLKFLGNIQAQPTSAKVTIIPINGHLSGMDKLGLIADFFMQNTLVLYSSALIGLALIALARPNPQRPHGYTLFVTIMSLLAASCFWFKNVNTTINNFQSLLPGITTHLMVMLAVVVVFLVTRSVSLRRDPITFPAFWLGLSGMLVFSLIGKVWFAGGKWSAFLDWRYPIYGYLALVLLSAGACRFFEAQDNGTKPFIRYVGAALLAVILTQNLLITHNHLAQTSAYGENQKAGAAYATELAAQYNHTLYTEWPYAFMQAPGIYNYGWSRWQDHNLKIRSIHNFEHADQSFVALVDDQLHRKYTDQTRSEQARVFGHDFYIIPPLRPFAQPHRPPFVTVMATTPYPILANGLYREDFDGARLAYESWLGFYARERWGGTDRTFRWAKSNGTLRFELGELTETATLTVSMEIMSYDGVPEQTLKLIVNGTVIEKQPVGPRWETITWQVPGGLLRANASNQIIFQAGGSTSPATRTKGASTDSRELAFACDWIELRLESEVEAGAE